MAWARRLGLLLALLLPVVSASTPGTVVRLNKAALSYGKGVCHPASACEPVHACTILSVCAHP